MLLLIGSVAGAGRNERRMGHGRKLMFNRRLIVTLALAASLGMSLGLACDVARAHDESKYPDFSGQWFRTYGGNPRYDPTKPLRKQEAPLTPEYQARFEA